MEATQERTCLAHSHRSRILTRGGHLQTAIDPDGDGKMRSLKYQIECDEMDQVTCDGLQQIYKRDGEEIFWEASRRLLIEVLKSIEYIGGDLPKP